MSGLEQRKKGRDEGLDGVPAITAVTVRSPDAAAAPAAWALIDGDLLDERRAAVPPFPLALLPPAAPARAAP